eukprot:6765821-Alexandrium_andersonii.AAC.1
MRASADARQSESANARMRERATQTSAKERVEQNLCKLDLEGHVHRLAPCTPVNMYCQARSADDR